MEALTKGASGNPFLGRLNSWNDWGVFQVLKNYYLKIISTILHPSEQVSVLARYSRFGLMPEALP